MESLLFYTNAAIVALLAFFLILHFSSLRNPNPSKNPPQPPEARGGWPIIGHLHLLGKLPHKTLSDLADKYGPIFTIRLGMKPALIVSNWELAKELFTTYDVAISTRPKSLAAKYLGYDYALFGLSPYGTYWRDIRKLVNIQLLSTRRLELLKNVRISEIENSIKELYKTWKINHDNKDGSGRVLVDMKKWFGDLTLNVVLRMVAGKRYFGASSASVSEEKEVRKYQKVIREFFYLLGVFAVADFIPYLRWLDIGGYERKMKKIGQEMDNMVESWLKEHREKKKKKDGGGRGGDGEDFMEVMLSLMEDSDLAAASSYDADTITKSTCVMLIAGGSDTTTVMLVWTLSLLMNNRHVLKNAQEEIDVKIGKERPVTESDITNLVYLQAIIKETLRLYPAGPLGGYREFTEDCIIGGYNVPKGTRLTLNLTNLQRDPKVWEDPLEFRPERFLTKHKDVDVRGTQFELIPFGAGRRICPGTNFGLQMLHLVMASLLQAFDFSTPFDEAIDMSESAGLTNCKTTPLDLLIAPRLSPSLYY